jgi:hypothetical protein
MRNWGSWALSQSPGQSVSVNSRCPLMAPDASVSESQSDAQSATRLDHCSAAIGVVMNVPSFSMPRLSLPPASLPGDWGACADRTHWPALTASSVPCLPSSRKPSVEFRKFWPVSDQPRFTI